MPIQLETIPCEVCRSEDWQTQFSKRDKFGIEKDPFTVVECRKCGLAYVNPRPVPEEIGRFYPENYQWKDQAGEKVSLLGRWVNGLERFYRFHQLNSEIDRLEKRVFPKPKKILDVGCGMGDRLHLLEKRGYEVCGVETSDAARHASRQYGLNVFQGKLQDAPFEPASFDCILFYNVLEHIHQPRKVLQNAKRLLKPYGWLVIEVPNRQCVQARKLKDRWAAVDIPRDLYYFETRNLEKLLMDEGLETLSVDYMTDFWHPPTLVISLFPSLDPQLIWSEDAARRKGGVVKRMLWAMMTLLLAPIVYLENLTKRGALMTLICRKKWVVDVPPKAD